MSAQAQPQDYAAAIYDLAFEPWIRQLETVQKALKKDAALIARLQQAGPSTQEKLALLVQATPERLSGDVRKFLGTLVEAGQLEQLDAILAEFEHLVRRRPERRLARVTSAVPLTEAERAALRATMVDRFGTDLEFLFEVEPALIGGVRLRVGDQVIDGSVAGKLAALRDRLGA